MAPPRSCGRVPASRGSALRAGQGQGRAPDRAGCGQGPSRGRGVHPWQGPLGQLAGCPQWDRLHLPGGRGAPLAGRVPLGVGLGWARGGGSPHPESAAVWNLRAVDSVWPAEGTGAEKGPRPRPQSGHPSWGPCPLPCPRTPGAWRMRTMASHGQDSAPGSHPSSEFGPSSLAEGLSASGA